MTNELPQPTTTRGILQPEGRTLTGSCLNLPGDLEQIPPPFWVSLALTLGAQYQSSVFD